MRAYGEQQQRRENCARPGEPGHQPAWCGGLDVVRLVSAACDGGRLLLRRLGRLRRWLDARRLHWRLRVDRRDDLDGRLLRDLGIVLRPPRNGDLPTRPDQVRVGQRHAVGLHGVAGCLEELGVAHRVAEPRLGDLRQGVPGLHDVLLGGTVGVDLRRLVRHLQHGAGHDEVGAPVQDPLVQVDDLGEPGAITEQAFGDLPQAVAAFDRVVDRRPHRRWRVCAGKEGRSLGEEGRNLDGCESRRFEDGRSHGTGWRSRERRDHGGSSNEQQCRRRDQLAHRPLWSAESRQCRSRETADLRDDFQDEGDRDDQPCQPRHARDDDHRERPVVGAGQQAPKRAEIGPPGSGTDADEQERHPGDEKQEGERGRETANTLGKRGLSHCSLPPRLRMSRAEAVLVTVRSPMPMKLRNLGLYLSVTSTVMVSPPVTVTVPVTPEALR